VRSGVGALKVCSKLGLGANPATPCEDRQLRKINCTLQNAVVEKGAEKFAYSLAIAMLSYRH